MKNVSRSMPVSPELELLELGEAGVPQQSTPDGWKLVPCRYESRAGLTYDMMRAFYVAFDLNRHRGDFERLNAAYNAMLDAAPTP